MTFALAAYCFTMGLLAGSINLLVPKPSKISYIAFFVCIAIGLGGAIYVLAS